MPHLTTSTNRGLKFVLCLSGGGFRATIFHLGVVDYLQQAGHLENVIEIYGVSGGAITAAHLVHHWALYTDPSTFPSTAKSLLDVCNNGIWEEILDQNAQGKSRTDALRNILKEHLFSSPLPAKRPRCYLLTTNLKDTSVFSYNVATKDTAQLLRLEDGKAQVDVLNEEVNISTYEAVAASAGFPVAFGPTTKTADEQGVLEREAHDHRLADGGIIDNLGTMFAFCNDHARDTDGLDNKDIVFLVSDAAQVYDDLPVSAIDASPAINTVSRTVDYLMKTLAEERLARLCRDYSGARQRFSRDSRQDQRVLLLRLADGRNDPPSWDTQLNGTNVTRAKKTRTHFDAFVLDELVVLYRLGIQVAHNVLTQIGAGKSDVNRFGLIRGQTVNGGSLADLASKVTVPAPPAKPSTLQSLFEYAARRFPGLKKYAAGVGLAIALMSLAGVVFMIWLGVENARLREAGEKAAEEKGRLSAENTRIVQERNDAKQEAVSLRAEGDRLRAQNKTLLEKNSHPVALFGSGNVHAFLDLETPALKAYEPLWIDQASDEAVDQIFAAFSYGRATESQNRGGAMALSSDGSKHLVNVINDVIRLKQAARLQYNYFLTIDLARRPLILLYRQGDREFLKIDSPMAGRDYPTVGVRKVISLFSEAPPQGVTRYVPEAGSGTRVTFEPTITRLSPSFKWPDGESTGSRYLDDIKGSLTAGFYMVVSEVPPRNAAQGKNLPTKKDLCDALREKNMGAAAILDDQGLIFATFTLVMKVVASGTGVDIKDPVECEVARAFIGSELDGSCHLADQNVPKTHIVQRRIEGRTPATGNAGLVVPEALQEQLFCHRVGEP